ncbi:peroxiredoxin [Basilea psittacipulmonis]|uniref:thioredoxin-dependent peroxiredoxin n=1 Tax=Basilea psittacipulmonis DSM 24701 TaxID=1072685 RepID=A0A077DH68_9BURK|nr:peroxiredoxin [Basilea psittacipulmonis]AIL32797.1 hypothetical protein IX83_05250 [Basilea psittacipulmonis DSM 24701]
MSVEIGKKVPTFQAQTQFGDISSNDFKGKITVLYFYPKDNTPGCTTEAQDFRDHLEAFKKLNIQVIGISKDTVKTHANFDQKHQLNFPLIADPEKEICQMFSVMKEKNMYGKKVWGIERSTFLFNHDAVLVKEWRGVKVPGHVQEVLQAAQELI